MKLSNLKIYYLLILSNNLWFITSNWLNFWLKYMTLKEVGIIDALAFLIGIMLEFPSGIISDRLGRKQTLLISQSLQLLGSLLITFSTSLYEIGLGFVVFQIGVAFYSGTIEAFGYESAISEKKEYTKVLTKSGFLTNFGYLSSLIVGGYLYNLNNNIPNILFTINFAFGLILSWFVFEILPSKQSEDALDSKNKFSLYTLLLFVILMCASFSFDYGFLKLVILDKFSTTESNYWYIFVATGVSLIISNFTIPLVKNYLKPLVISSTVLFLSYILKSFSYAFLFFALSFLAVFVYQLSLKYLNEKVSDSTRAQVISIFNLFYKLPYVLIALYLGYNLA
jgi:MFS family permease